MIKKLKINKEYLFETILVALIPFNFVLSIFFLELSLLCLSISFILRNLNKEIFKYFSNKFIIIFSLFYLYILLRYFFINFENDEFISILFYFRFGLYILALFFFLEKIEELEKYFLISLVFTFVILIFDGFYQFLFQTNIIGYPLIDGTRVTSFFGDESILGSYLVKFLPFIFLVFSRGYFNSKYLPIFLFLILSTNIMIFLSGERASFFLMLMVNLYLIILMKDFKFLKILFFLISLIFIVILFFNFEYTKNRYLSALQKILKTDNAVNNELLPKNYTDSKFYLVSPTHNNYAITSYKMFKDNILFGQGTRSYRYLCGEKNYGVNLWSCSSHPHNYYLQILAELGFIGFLFPSIFFIYLSFKSLRIFLTTSLKNNTEICILSIFFLHFWPLTTTGNFFNNWISISICIPISFYLFYKKKNVIY